MYEIDIGVLFTGSSWYQRETPPMYVVCCTLQPDTEDNLITRRETEQSAPGCVACMCACYLAPSKLSGLSCYTAFGCETT